MMIFLYVYLYAMVFSIFMVVAGPFIGVEVSKYDNKVMRFLFSSYYLVFLFFPLLTIYVIEGIFHFFLHVKCQLMTDWKIYHDSWKR